MYVEISGLFVARVKPVSLNYSGEKLTKVTKRLAGIFKHCVTALVNSRRINIDKSLLSESFFFFSVIEELVIAYCKLPFLKQK